MMWVGPLIRHLRTLRVVMRLPPIYNVCVSVEIDSVWRWRWDLGNLWGWGRRLIVIICQMVRVIRIMRFAMMMLMFVMFMMMGVVVAVAVVLVFRRD
jgi:hypothetical protein